MICAPVYAQGAFGKFVADEACDLCVEQGETIPCSIR